MTEFCSFHTCSQPESGVPICTKPKELATSPGTEILKHLLPNQYPSGDTLFTVSEL